jgi:divinyl protochlorophyllide a 8-vinyl-reductase
MHTAARPTASSASHAPSDVPRIGPNAIIQTAGVLRDRVGAERAATLLLRATGYDLHALPTDMVDEREPLALVQAVLREFGPAHSASIMREAGQRTAEYLLGNRIPGVAQWVMRLAPRRVGLAILLKAMKSNAWTFAGSGSFEYRQSKSGTELTFGSCAMCRGMLSSVPMCDFYAGTFEHLIQVLVCETVHVVEVECIAHGGRYCRFALQGMT